MQIQGMQLEARSRPAVQAQPLLEQVARCNAELAQLQTELRGGGLAPDRTALVRSWEAWLRWGRFRLGWLCNVEEHCHWNIGRG